MRRWSFLRHFCHTFLEPSKSFAHTHIQWIPARPTRCSAIAPSRTLRTTYILKKHETTIYRYARRSPIHNLGNTLVGLHPLGASSRYFAQHYSKLPFSLLRTLFLVSISQLRSINRTVFCSLFHIFAQTNCTVIASVSQFRAQFNHNATPPEGSTILFAPPKNTRNAIAIHTLILF